MVRDPGDPSNCTSSAQIERMTPDDIAGFYATRGELNAEDYIELEFSFECAGDPREAAAHLCSEQSTAQWRRVGVDEDFRPRFAAKVLELEAEPRPSGFSLPVTCDARGSVHACRATIAHPHGNFGPRIPNLLSAVCGEGVFFSPGIPLIRLEDIRFPETYLAAFEGPQFGVAGLRAQLNAYARPIFFGVIKPNIGLPPEPFAALGYQSWLGGLDIAKDDEMLADAPWCPLEERASALGAACKRAGQETGTPKIYLANITDEVGRLQQLHDIAVAKGAGAVLVNTMPVGLSAVRMLRGHARVPLVAHFPMIASFSRLAAYGIHSRVLTRLQRLAGLDVVIMPGFGSRMMMPEHEVLDCVKACLAPMGTIKPCLPVPGGSDWAGTLEGVYRKVGTPDFGFVPGRGVFSHPMGPAGGAASLRQAWDAIAAGIPIETYAATHEELRVAMHAFGNK
jgi:ribulose-bisphosphate carboxylase large chain